MYVQYQWSLPERLTAVRAHVPGQQLSCVRVKHIHVLMVQQLHELGRFQKLPLAVKHTGGLFGRVNQLPRGQREDHHNRVLRTPQNSWWTLSTQTALIKGTVHPEMKTLSLVTLTLKLFQTSEFMYGYFEEFWNNIGLATSFMFNRRLWNFFYPFIDLSV